MLRRTGKGKAPCVLVRTSASAPPLPCSTHSLHLHRGFTKETRGTAYVVYEDIYDAKNACDHLSGFNVANRYLIVLYWSKQHMQKKV